MLTKVLVSLGGGLVEDNKSSVVLASGASVPLVQNINFRVRDDELVFDNAFVNEDSSISHIYLQPLSCSASLLRVTCNPSLSLSCLNAKCSLGTSELLVEFIGLGTLQANCSLLSSVLSTQVINLNTFVAGASLLSGSFSYYTIDEEASRAIAAEKTLQTNIDAVLRRAILMGD